MGKFFFTVGVFTAVLGTLYRLTLWATFSPGIQPLYWLVLALSLTIGLLLTSHNGRNLMANNTTISAFSWA
ncbi:hypothetical protein [Lyngbya sp. PCC 8106]|uniref:hypothetical protein n=1 Tax=Lyngbya sp. (strain PCC 8106) TaxID=313612 RepID=UPI0012E9DA42|nr:hypothetical protein [Lyngbya sp. PCC 8106]